MRCECMDCREARGDEYDEDYEGEDCIKDEDEDEVVQEKVDILDCWSLFDRVVDHCSRILLWGPPGTGKTYQAIMAGKKAGDDVQAVLLTEDTPGAELRGHFVPKGGEYHWHDGPALIGWACGTRLVVDEIQRGMGDAQSILLKICDDPRYAKFTLPSGKTVRPLEGFQVIATSNDPPESLMDALRDRFSVAINIDSVHPGAVACLSLDLQDLARKSLMIADPERRGSVRPYAEFDQLRKVVGDHVAAQAVFGHRAQDLVDALALAR